MSIIKKSLIEKLFFIYMHVIFYDKYVIEIVEFWDAFVIVSLITVANYIFFSKI